MICKGCAPIIMNGGEEKASSVLRRRDALCCDVCWKGCVTTLLCLFLGDVHAIDQLFCESVNVLGNI